MKYPLIVACGLAALGTLALTSEAPAQSDRSASEDRRCVTLREIDKTSVVDEASMLFYLKNGSIYENRFGRRCPGLDDRAVVSYRLVLDQLCDGDTINVLERHAFGGFVQMASCGLGSFRPVTEEDAKALLAKKSDR